MTIAPKFGSCAWCIFILLWCLNPEASLGQRPKKAKVYAGGTMGITDMLAPKASNTYRKRGGGLFLHNSGWGKLSVKERRRLLSIFKNAPIAIEIGNTPINWPQWLKGAYIDLGIRPHFVTVNVFMRMPRRKGEKLGTPNVPTANQWKKTYRALRKVTPKETLILPTFEFANFGEHRHRLISGRISRNKQFQKIVALSRGLTLDVPPVVFFRRELNYRTWVVDALLYAKRKHYTSVLIISPDNSGNKFTQHTSNFLSFLHQQNALPTVLVIENYVWGPKNYPNRIGNDNTPNTILGLANKLVISRAIKPRRQKR